jgi:hypothetical protein
LVGSLPSDVSPSKNSTLVTLPSVSLAAAWRLTVAGLLKEALSGGWVRETLGDALAGDGVERV